MTYTYPTTIDWYAYSVHGMKYGALAGLISSLIYLVCFVLALFRTSIVADPLSALVTICYFLVIGLFIGILPALLIGGLVGMIAGLFVYAPLSPYLTPRRGVVIGFICACIAGTLALWYVLDYPTRLAQLQAVVDWYTYLSFAPFVIGSGMWAGYRLGQDAQFL